MTTTKPKVGDQIYIPSIMFVDKDELGVRGGLAIIETVTKNSFGSPFISAENIPSHYWNYSVLLEKQTNLKKEFGNETACLDYGTLTSKKFISQLAKANISNALAAVIDVTSSVHASPEFFDEGDRQAIKAIKLGLLRLQNKLTKKKS